MSTSARHDSVKAYRQAEHTRTGSEREQEVLRHLLLVHTVVDRVADAGDFRHLNHPLFPFVSSQINN